MKLCDRVVRLEARKGPKTLHWIDPSYEGQPLEEAVADYQAARGNSPNAVIIHWNVFRKEMAA